MTVCTLHRTWRVLSPALALVAGAIAGGTASAQVDEAASLTFAMDLGNILASAEFCGIEIDDAGVSALVASRVDPADMRFPITLNMFSSVPAGHFAEMSSAQKTAHCVAVVQSATHYGLVKQ